jgi:hypothetical protein
MGAGRSFLAKNFPTTIQNKTVSSPKKGGYAESYPAKIGLFGLLDSDSNPIPYFAAQIRKSFLDQSNFAKQPRDRKVTKSDQK